VLKFRRKLRRQMVNEGTVALDRALGKQ
jgi:hypothetical protein